ncbi:hypothetical protein BJV78DRAFT_1282682 [Lactifluus subvellereus]|nr:hypothetical protein BJV78DRAFT_1282682 [Lactifluus subvellereus]
MQNAEQSLTPPAAARGFLSFARAQGQAAQSRREVPGPPSLATNFDAGINTSNAWTVYLDSDSSRSRSLSDDEGEDDNSEEDIDGRGARVLFAFAGNAEFGELDVKAGDAITVIREQAGDEWSLVKTRPGVTGLLPRSYYTFTVDFISAPETGTTLHSRHLSDTRRDPSTASLTPRGSATYASPPPPTAKPIIAQTTGERMMAALPSIRQGLLGGKSLNRFSSFVTSGAEAYVLNGASASKSDAPPTSLRHVFEASDDEESTTRTNAGPTGATDATCSSEADKHFVDAGPSWRYKVPPFRVLVHSPSKRTSTLSGAYTVYHVSSLFRRPPTSRTSDTESADSINSSPNPSRITVHRRFSHFVVLNTALTRRLPGIALPPLPEKQYAGRFNDDFVEARRGDLERYLARIVRHPVARYAEILTFFLSCERMETSASSPPRLPPAGPSFYANVFHPDFNFDAEEATEAVNRFDVHTKAVDTGVQGLRNVFSQIRQARVEMSKAERLLSYSLLSLITTKPIATLPNAGVTFREEDSYSPFDHEEMRDDEEYKPVKKGKGYVNEQGAWCWREGCEDCLKLTRALQKTSETLQGVADLYDDHARRTQLATHDALKDVAHPSQLYAPDEEVASRCETVLNITMAEMETYHTQKVEDFASLAKEHLDGEIEFHEQVLNRLRTARRTFEPPIYPRLTSATRQPSIYERDLERPRLNPDPLPQPCPHVFDATPMRPVSHAIQEGVGLLLGGAASAVTGRGSVFGRLW